MGLLLGYYGCGLQVTAGEAVWPRLGRMILCALLLGAATSSGQVAESIVDLTTLSLEELMEVEVTTVAKKEQPLFEAPAAVYVIAQEDIRRSGFTHLAEVLRLAPGLQVAQIDASKWAVSARGFNDRFANKLLVLVDGRIVYTSLFSGVFWEVQDLVLEDVARIEVIRGPGAALWGANAVNGVINIITKNAQDTRGGLVVAGAGSEDRGMGVVRYGGRLAETAHYRVYARYGDRDQLIDRNGEQTNDAWQIGRGGFRLDWQPSGRDALILMGDVYDGDLDQTLDKGAFLEPPYTRMFDFETRISGASVLGRWERSLSAVEEVKGCTMSAAIAATWFSANCAIPWTWISSTALKQVDTRISCGAWATVSQATMSTAPSSSLSIPPIARSRSSAPLSRTSSGSRRKGCA
jgi:iron complex outermembrane receptor protein